MKKEYFSKNKIQEALCQFAFKTPLDLSRASEFSKIILESKRFSKIEEIPLVNFNLNLVEGGFKKEQHTGLKIVNEKGDKVIQVFSDNLSIHQVGNYDKWETFRADIDFVLEQFSKVYQVEIGRMDLRAINNFDFIDEEYKINEFLNFSISIPKSNFATNSINFTVEQEIINGKEYTAIRSTFNSKQKKLIFDLSYVWFFNESLIRTDSGQEISNYLDKGNLCLYETFAQALKETAKKTLK